MSQAPTTVLSEAERDRAKAIGAVSYPRSKRYRLLRERHVFSALDAAVRTMDALKFTNPYDGRILGGLATVLFQNDPKAIGFLRRRKVAALDDAAKRKELFELIGLLIAEDYLRARRKQIPEETRLTDPRRLLDSLEDLFDQMRQAGEAMAAETVGASEMAVRFTNLEDPANIARGLIEDAVGTYESLVPEVEGDDEIPNPVERRALAKAAFLRLGVDDLVDQATRDNLGELPNKDALAQALAEQYADDLDQVAELVLAREGGNPDYGLVTRLVPLREVPDLGSLAEAFRSLRGHYIEPRTALFFVFGDVASSATTLRVSGRIRSFTVNPAEAGGATQLNFRPHSEDISIIVRAGHPWAEVDTRRASGLHVVHSVLRRTGEVLPRSEVEAPQPLSRDPFSDWDPRTLWMLDFLRLDLQSPQLRLDDTLMAHFVARATESDADDDQPERRRPTVDAVRLLGTQLHEHPEACALIATGSHLSMIEVRIRKALDRQGNTSRLIRVRLAWEKDHLAVMSGASVGADRDQVDVDFHRQMVGLVRGAADRSLAEEGLLFTLRQIERRAAGEIPDDDASVLDADSAN